MRWFTEEAERAADPDDDAAWRALLVAYEAHVRSIADRLPAGLATFATDPRLHLHDARFEEVRVDDDAATIDLSLVLGDLRLRLRFGQARFDSDDLRSVAYAVGATYVTDHWGTTRTVVMHQEVGLADEGQGVLRLRLYPFHEIGITCSTFALSEEPAPPDDGRPGILRIAGDEEAHESEQADGSGRFEA